MNFLDKGESRGRITVKVMMKSYVRKSDLVKLIKQLHEPWYLQKIRSRECPAV